MKIDNHLKLQYLIDKFCFRFEIMPWLIVISGDDYNYFIQNTPEKFMEKNNEVTNFGFVKNIKMMGTTIASNTGHSKFPKCYKDGFLPRIFFKFNDIVVSFTNMCVRRIDIGKL